MGVGSRGAIAVLMGGTSAEHDVSVCSGLNVLDAILGAKRPARPIYITRGGEWHFDFRPAAPSLERLSADRDAQIPVPDAASPPVGTSADPGGVPATPVAPTGGTLETLRDGSIDVVFVALHGPGGEDGAVQGLLSHAGVPFTGSGVLASALAMDKSRAKLVMGAAGIPVATDAVVDEATLEAGCETACERVGFPCVVKPVAGGSSFGTRIVHARAEFEPAVREALEHDRRVLVETYLPGRELTCGVLGGGAEPAEALPITEIRPLGEEFFDFRAKYTASACEEITPARIDEAVAERVQSLARAAHRALGCEGMSRADFILTEHGAVMLEVNTIPGMTRTSLLPQGAAAAGIPFEALVERMIESARRRARAVSC